MQTGSGKTAGFLLPLITRLEALPRASRSVPPQIFNAAAERRRAWEAKGGHKVKLNRVLLHTPHPFPSLRRPRRC